MKLFRLALDGKELAIVQARNVAQALNQLQERYRRFAAFVTVEEV